MLHARENDEDDACGAGAGAGGGARWRQRGACAGDMGNECECNATETAK